MAKNTEEAPPPDIMPSILSKDPSAPISSLPVKLSVEDYTSKYPQNHLSAIVNNWRLSCYLAVAQIFLQKNALVDRKLEADDIKPRLLGHYGTTGGLSLAYVHGQALIRRRGDVEGTEPKMLFVTGPGHGAPAILSNLYIEGAITKFYPQYSLDRKGLEKFVKYFSWPGGFPSHVNAETPGCIHEGGELGYALAVAYGSVMDRPDQISIVVVGDGESETGPTATAWHSHKWLDPKESGAVLPILHVNGFKISERTIPGTMDDTELSLLYSGYGYQVRFVEYEGDGQVSMGGGDPADAKLHANMAASMDWAYEEIRKIQKAARDGGKPIDKPRWPMIILRSPKGWTGPPSEHGKQLLNNFASHQVPLPDAKTDENALGYLERWLKSYEAEQYFDFSEENVKKGTIFKQELYDALPKDIERRMGNLKETYDAYEPLDLADWKEFGYEKAKEDVSCMKAIGKYLVDVIERNPKTFRMFSPDELASNKLDAVLDAPNGGRDFQWDPLTAHKGGRVTEMLSEHTLQGWLQGYTLTGRHGLFPSYEAFLGIIATMMVQYSKFLRMGLETGWRSPVAALTYIETSTWTRQEHNGYSHQNPGFIGTVLSLPTNLARVYFPADANTSVSVIKHCLGSKNYVNLIVGTKAPTPVFLTVEEADAHCTAGISIWKSYSIDEGVDPDVVLVGIGFELQSEVISAAAQLKKDFGSDLRVRVINIVDLLVLAPDHPHALNEAGFNSLFPPGVPVVINYHGYPNQIAGLLFNRAHGVGRARFRINGYIEEGTTTTPFVMMLANRTDRYNVAKDALELVTQNFTATQNIKGDERRYRVGKVIAKVHERTAHYTSERTRMLKYAEETQMDHPDVGQVAVLAEQ